MSADGQRPLALVADNDLDGQWAAVAALTRIGFEACVVDNGPAALAVFKTRHPQFVLLICDLPGMSGAAVCRAIRQDPEGVGLPIIMIGDIDSDVAIDEAYRAGITDFLPRPRNWNLAVHRLSYLVRTNRAEQELSRAHALLLDAIDIFPGTFAVYDQAGKLIIVNERFRRVAPRIRLGMTREEVLHAALDSGTIDTAGEPRDAWVARQLEDMSIDAWSELAFLDGQHSRQICKYMADGGCFVVSIDITQEKRRQAALSASKEEAEAANRIKAHFLSGMSHEIRTPLNAIIGFSDIIQKEMVGVIENRSYVEYAADINKSGNSLLEILTLILDISKLEAGRLALPQEECAVARIAACATAKYRMAAREKNVSLVIGKLDGLSVLGDQTRLGRALACLVNNAIKFSPRHAVVAIDAQITAAGFAIRVQDDGAGMDKDTAAQALSAGLATPAGLAPASLAPAGLTAQPLGGLGMGLAYARTLMHAHGGRLVIETTPGSGTTASLVLPLERLLGDDATSAEIAASAARH